MTIFKDGDPVETNSEYPFPPITGNVVGVRVLKGLNIVDVYCEMSNIVRQVRCEQLQHRPVWHHQHSHLTTSTIDDFLL